MSDKEEFIIKAVKHRDMVLHYSPDKIEQFLMSWLTGPANAKEAIQHFGSLSNAYHEVMNY